MKKLLFFCVMALAIVSCVGETEYVASGNSFGVAFLSNENPFGYRIMLDNGSIAEPISVPELADGETQYLPTENERVYLYLEATEPWIDIVDVNIMSIVKVPCSDILVANEIDTDTLGVDPVLVDNDYVYLTQSFLNVYYTYREASDAPYSHNVYLVHYPDSVDEDGCEFFKLQHNANGDLEEVNTDAYQCFDMKTLDAFAEGADSVNFEIHIEKGMFSDASSLYKGTYYKPSLDL